METKEIKVNTLHVMDNPHYYTDNPEFVSVQLDSNDKVLSGTYSDGSHYMHNLKSESFDAKVDKENGKSLINSSFADSIDYIDNPEWLEVTISNNNKVIKGVKKDGTVYNGNVSISNEEILKCQEDIAKNAEDISKNSRDITAALDAYQSVVSNIESVEEGVERNAAEIDRIKEIEGFSVAEEVEDRLENIESDVSDLKADAGIGTDIISLNGGEKTIKDMLYGFKHIAFKDITKVRPDYIARSNDCLVLLHFSDIHDDSTNAARLKQFYDTFKMINGITAIDDAVFTGDVCSMTYGYTRSVNYWSTWGIENMLFGIGNHDIIMGTDYGTFEDSAGWGKVPTTELYNKFIAPYVSNWNVVQPSDAAAKGKLYYYKDYPALGFRLFMLDCFDYRKPYRDDNGVLTEIQNTWNYRHEHVLASLSDIGTITDAVPGTLFYVTVVANQTYDTYVVDTVSGNQITAYTPVVWQRDTQLIAEQNTWFENALSEAKTLGYHVITTRHETQSYGTAIDSPWNTLDSEGSALWTQQGADIDRLSNEFVANGGVIACELYGHWHCDMVQLRNNNIFAITVANAIGWQDYGNNIRVTNEKSMDAFNIMALDKVRGLITLYRIGVDKDMYGRGKHIFVYDYINKEIKYQY